MANTRIGGGKPAKGSVRTAAKAHKKAGPARDFSAELVKAGKPGQAPKKPSPQSSGPEIVESDTGVTRHLEILGSKRAGTQRTVEITGSVSRFNKHGDIVDGGLAHAGRVTKSATVTVTVRDQTGTTTRSYKGSEVRPTTVEIGSQTTDVKVRGTFGGSVAVLPGRPGR